MTAFHPSLGDTLALATMAHAGQSYGDDPATARPYIEHPVAVAGLLLPLTVGDGPLSLSALHAALLHDVVEDTAVTLAHLADCGYSQVIVDAVDAVSRRPGEQYASLVDRAAAHRLGRWVKLADNTHNLSTLPTTDRRYYRYVSARRVLVAAVGRDPWPGTVSEI